MGIPWFRRRTAEIQRRLLRQRSICLANFTVCHGINLRLIGRDIVLTGRKYATGALVDPATLDTNNLIFGDRDRAASSQWDNLSMKVLYSQILKNLSDDTRYIEAIAQLFVSCNRLQ